MVCNYCVSFLESKEKVDKNTRYCSTKRLYVFKKKIKCAHFVASKTFWCNKNQYWLDLTACAIRQAEKREGCIKCTQGKVVTDICRSKR